MSTKVLVLRIGITGHSRLHVSRFRELVAKVIGEAPALFHRDPDGKPSKGIPKVRFIGGKTWVGVAFDEELSDLLYQHMGLILQSVSSETGSVARAEVETHTIDCTVDNIPRSYWIRELVLKRRGPEALDMEINYLIEKRVLKGLVTFDRHHGLMEMPDDWFDTKLHLSFELVDVIRPRGLRIQTTTGTTNEYATLVDVGFVCCANLEGIWSVGNLTSRGYGRILKNLQGEAFMHMRKTQSNRAYIG